MIRYDVFSSPVGALTVSSDESGITELHIEGDRYFTEIPVQWRRDPTETLLQQVKLEVEEYFSGQRQHFAVPLAIQGTLFQRDVWAVLQAIPFGSTISYGAIARKIGRPKAVRAVGTAVGRNPACILVPCHRVVGSSGGFGGYVAGIECKQRLLRLEGAPV
ncbi:MAG TPA: methylated-DNA--[protein]-cysteine S-methyltransferase [Candidatus Polarisedimenticolaceae bacterium]|nr:methylated-DNA--[protein]-cysteine S-methyltransferase [Candidatus Polarisedimenticolaceae bacterium]